jgi:hypothetical protein
MARSATRQDNEEDPNETLARQLANKYKNRTKAVGNEGVQEQYAEPRDAIKAALEANVISFLKKVEKEFPPGTFLYSITKKDLDDKPLDLYFTVERRGPTVTISATDKGTLEVKWVEDKRRVSLAYTVEDLTQDKIAKLVEQIIDGIPAPESPSDEDGG